MYPSPTSAARSEDETQQGQPPRKRTARACDSCYKRKIKCDAALPQCNWCSHHDIPCTFERSTQRKRRERGNGDRRQKTSHLAERIGRIEKLVSQGLLQEPNAQVSLSTPNVALTSQSATSSPGNYDRNLLINSNSPGKSPGQQWAPAQPAVSSSMALHFAGREFGVTSLITGIPFLLPEGQQWIESRTGQSVDVSRLGLSRPPWEKQRTLSSNTSLMNLQPKDILELPDQNLVQGHFEIYRSSLMQRIFPILDSVLFQETIKIAYQQPSNGHYRQTSASACVFAFVTFASLIHQPAIDGRSIHLPKIETEVYAVKAQSLVPHILQDPPTIDGLQAVSMLTLIELITGNLQSADYFGSLAARLSFMLGAHTASDTNDPATSFPESIHDRTKRHLRNIFWLGYTIEKDVSLRTGQPIVLSDENCDLTLPPGYVERLYTSMAYHHHSQELPEYPLFPVDLRLSIIKSRAYSALYSFKALQKTDAELLKEIRQLDDELERWRFSVPVEWRPTLSFSHETPDPNLSMHSVMLRLNYHLCMTIIHAASSRCKSWIQGQGGMMDGVSSSLALSVEASRSTLLYLETAEPVLVDGVFWSLIFYPMSAVLAIFCNTLQNPSGPQATKDLSLLKTATGIMERVFLRQLSSVNEIVHIKRVADFVTELYRLARCAMEKAYHERS